MNIDINLKELTLINDILCRAYIFDDFLDESERCNLKSVIDKLCDKEREVKYGI